MKEKEKIKAIIEAIEKQDNNWAYRFGREKLKKKAFIQKLKKDRKFRKFIIDSTDIYTIRMWASHAT